MNIEKIVGWIVGAAVAVAIIILMLCTVRIPAGYVGVQYSMDGGVKDDILTQGWHIISPTTHVTTYTIGLEQSYLTASKQGDSPNDDSFTASSSEGKSVKIDLTYTYQYEPENVVAVFNRFKGQSGKEVRDSFIKPNIVSWTKEVIAQYKIADILGSKRPEINTELTKYLDQKFDKYGITISNVSLIDLSVDDDTMKVINDKIAAQQNAEKQKIENQTAIDKATADATVKTTQAQADADALLIEAEAEAEANRKVAQSLTPELIEQKKIDKWNGTLPTVEGGSNPIVNLNTSESNDN